MIGRRTSEGKGYSVNFDGRLLKMESANRVLLFQVAQKIVSGKRGKKS
jgi:hypothetical protein